ncbi:MAG: hypothetical protein V4622_11805 [Bacteroidota bacterium]
MKTINKISLAIGILLFSNSLHSQLNGGVFSGVTTSAVEIKHVDRGFTDVINGNNIMGYEAGVFLKYKASSLYIKPMAIYNYQSGHVTYQGETVSYTANKVGIPVLFGLNLVGPVSLEAGPVYNYLVDVTRDFEGQNTWNYGKNGLGYRAGLALDFGPLILNASYEGMTYMNNTSQTQFREPYKLIFGAALKFGGGDQK